MSVPPPPSTESTTGAYIWDVDSPQGYANAMGRYRTRIERDFIHSRLSGRGLRILDIGGGSGRFAVDLADRGHHVTVVDLSPKAISLIERRRHPRVEALCGDFMSLPLTGPFDAALGIESIQSFTQLPLHRLFAKVAHLLCPGGLFLFTELNARSWRFRGRAMTVSARDQYNVLTPEGYRDSLEQAGFQIISTEGFVWMPFRVSSNSLLVPAFAAAERMLGLGKWVSQSPWLLIAAERGS